MASTPVLPVATLTPGRDFDPTRHDVRVLELVGRLATDWDFLQSGEVIREQVNDLTDMMLTDGAFGDAWQAVIASSSSLLIKPGRIKVGKYIIELFTSEDRTLSLIPTVQFENLLGNGKNDDKSNGNYMTFQLANSNLWSMNGGLAKPPSGNLNEFNNNTVDFYVQGTDAFIQGVDAANGFITFSRPPTAVELTRGVLISYHYGKTGTQAHPTYVYATIELIRVTENEDSYLIDPTTRIANTWRDKFKITFVADTVSQSWAEIKLNALSHTGTYYVFPICTVVEGKLASDDRLPMGISTTVAPFGDHTQLENLDKDSHPQYLTGERHAGVDHSEFLAGISKLAGITVFNMSGYSDRSNNVSTVKPYLINSISIDKNHVDVYFSEKMDQSTILNSSNYSIRRNRDNYLLPITSTTIVTDSHVQLYTNDQTDDTYTITVVNVKDSFGNIIDVTQNTKQFAGKSV